jgi:hypothetical protein
MVGTLEQFWRWMESKPGFSTPIVAHNTWDCKRSRHREKESPLDRIFRHPIAIVVPLYHRDQRYVWVSSQQIRRWPRSRSCGIGWSIGVQSKLHVALRHFFENECDYCLQSTTDVKALPSALPQMDITSRYTWPS